MINMVMFSSFREFMELSGISAEEAAREELIPWFAEPEDLIAGFQADKPLHDENDWLPEFRWLGDLIDDGHTYAEIDKKHYYLVWETEC